RNGTFLFASHCLCACIRITFGWLGVPMIKTLTAFTIALGLSCALLADVAAAQSEDDSSSVEVQLSNDTLQLRYETGGDPLGVDEGRLFGAFFLSEERDIVISAGLSFPADLNIGRLSVLLGPQVYAALLEDENNDVMSVSI